MFRFEPKQCSIGIFFLVNKRQTALPMLSPCNIIATIYDFLKIIVCKEGVKVANENIND